MPSALVKKLADKKGISIEKAEGYWDSAKEKASEQGHGEEYDYITAIFKKMIGESLTFQEMQIIESGSTLALQNTIWLSTKQKVWLSKRLNNKRLRAAVAQYVTFRKQGVRESDAVHKAGSMFGFADKVFSEIIWDMQKSGLLEAKIIEQVYLFLHEEGEPTNTSMEVAPDRDHVGEKSTMRRKKKKNCTKSEKGTTMKSETWEEFAEKLHEATGMKMDASSKRKASNAIAKYASKNYFSTPSDPVTAADDALRAVGYRLVQEDGTDFSAIFTGREGRASIRISPVDAPDSPKSMVNNTMLAVQWYKMDKSNKYEVNMYLS